MDYKKHYDNLILTRKNRPLDANKLYERHHIIMKSMGGSNNDDNLVYLTPREHFVAHLLLWKIYRNNKTAYAMHALSVLRRKEREPIKINSRVYQEIKEALRLKPWGKHTDEMKLHFSNTRKGKNNSMYNKTHSDKTKQKIASKSKIQCSGSTNPRAKKLYQYDLNKNLIKIWDCVSYFLKYYKLGTYTQIYTNALQNTEAEIPVPICNCYFSYKLLNNFNNIENDILFNDFVFIKNEATPSIIVYEYNTDLKLLNIYKSRKIYCKLFNVCRKKLNKYAQYNDISINNFKLINNKIVKFNKI